MPTPKRNQTPSNLWQFIKPYQSARNFENDVIHFHQLHRTPIRHLPYVLGRRINLKKLYINVIKRGGYKKVNEKELWDEVLEELNLPKEATNSELALQTIYHRYLEAYERNQWNCLGSGQYKDNNGEKNVNLDVDLLKHSAFISDLTMRDRSVLGSFVYENTPKIYSDYRQIISNSVRTDSGLSVDLKDTAELKHITMSLKSGLNNEIDFALNTLLIMSNNDRILPDLRFTGNLIDLVVATVGVVDIIPGSFFEQFKDYPWMQNSLKFWNKTVEEGVGRMFLVPNIFSCSKSDIKQIQRDCNITSSNIDTNELFNDDNQYHKIIDPCCQRIHLVATIIHNLVLDSLNNSKTIVNNNQVLRFLLLAAHARDSVLRRLSLHTLTKLRFVLCSVKEKPSETQGLMALLSTDIDQITEDIDRCYMKNEEESDDDEWFTEFLLDFLMTLLTSENRCDRISAFEMVQSLCLIEDNHETLSRHLRHSFLIRLSAQLFIPDIHPLCCALEALVSLSQLGDNMCRRLATCKSLLKCLLQFVNIEAQMFGPTAVYKIKTFNCRPPIPPSPYHSLPPQIVRLPPTQNSLRAMAPFANPVGPFIPNANHNYIRSPNINSISTHSLSTPPLYPIKSPENFNNYITNHNSNPPLNKSQLTPLQQIDHLLTKNIDSFATPSPSPLSLELQKNNNNNNNAVEREKTEGKKMKIDEKKSVKNVSERKIVVIKCCVDSEDLEIEDVNNVRRLKEEEKMKKDNNTVVNGNVSENVTENAVNGKETIIEEVKVDENGSSSPLEDREEKRHAYQNGTLEVEVLLNDEEDDPDRRQMPPPSLPTPSMLKKQMRPKSAQIISSPTTTITTNGYLSQLNCNNNKDQKSKTNCETMTLEDRCEQVKQWLKKNFKVTDDVTLFVTKKQLVVELQEALFDIIEENQESSDKNNMILSAQDLHCCIKDIFGQRVQVKVEHGPNGNSQLIYCHLGRIDDEKLTSNGVLNPVCEMNGFASHSFKRKKSPNDIDDDEVIQQKKICEDIEESKESINQSKITNPIIIQKDKILTNKKKSRRNGLPCLLKKVKQKYKVNKSRKLKVAVKPELSSRKAVNSVEPSPTIVTNIQGHIPCLWSNCLERFIDLSSLQTHITDNHLSINLSSTTTTTSSPTRSHCQWRDCASSHVPRAPLSLLSHVIQEHCQFILPIQMSPNVVQQSQMVPNQYNVISPPSINNTSSYNAMVQSNIMYGSNMPQNSSLEKSGWSVLYDHFRMDEQLQPNLPEGPITKHIRISSSIILRNISRHSIIAKEFLRSHEKHLSAVALNSQDCSSIILQCLEELNVAPSSLSRNC